MEEVLVNEGEGLASEGPLGGSSEGGALIWFIMSIFSETRASV
jgi:hypothetical protein